MHKFFIGIPITPTISFSLSTSSLWDIDSSTKQTSLIISTINEKQYLGFFLEQPHINLSILQDSKHKLENQIHKFIFHNIIDPSKIKLYLLVQCLV